MLKGSTVFMTGLALCMACFGQTESGPPSHVKLIEDFIQAPAPAPNMRSPRNFDPKQMEAQRIRIARALQAGPRCGHIIVKPVPPGIDSKSIRGVPKGDEAMIHKAMPACPEDIR